MRLGEICRDVRRDLEGASWAFKRASESAEPGPRLEGQVALAEAWLELGGDAGAARRLLESVVGSLGDRPSDAARRAWLRVGDARMIAGEGAAAREAYGKALALAGGPENAERILRKAGAARSALTALETGDLPRAAEHLRAWEWQDPMDRFVGFHRIVKAKVHRVRGEPALAERELAALLAGNPDSEYADEALYLLAETARATGRPADADAFLDRLRRDYPWSPLSR
jgi:tetratricopeptide (TPR) repeat protein